MFYIIKMKNKYDSAVKKRIEKNLKSKCVQCRCEKTGKCPSRKHAFYE